MKTIGGIHWTNKSVLLFANGEDPVALIERKARDLVFRAIDGGWQGPPFNPVKLADLLGINAQPNSEVADAQTVTNGEKIVIEYNPTQSRERMRFSIAHEIAHTLFPDYSEATRHRGGSNTADDWQLELLCNIAAAEFVMPVGSIPAHPKLSNIELLMTERRKFDVSAEAFLMRMVKVVDEPVLMFCASATESEPGVPQYKIDYDTRSQSAPALFLRGKAIPKSSVVSECSAIGYTIHREENFFSSNNVLVECVGIPGYPGSLYPRVAGIVRFASERAKEPIRYVHGDVLNPHGHTKSVVCQLVNDKARVWGGGVAKLAAAKFPLAQKDFSSWLPSVPFHERLGTVHFARVNDNLTIASLVGQSGFGPSATPRIRYQALEQCFEKVKDFSVKESADVHLPRIGTGGAGASWEAVEEILRSVLVDAGISVTVYDTPPKRISANAELFDWAHNSRE